MNVLYYGILSVLSAMGVWGLGVRLVEGLKVTALTSYASWGIWVAFYIFFIGLSAGSFLLSTMVYVFNMHKFERVGRLALLSAFFSLVAGMVFILIDLGHPERFWHTLVYRQVGSVLSWEIHFYLVYLILIVSELWLLMREDLSMGAKTHSGFKGFLYRVFAAGYSVPDNPRDLENHRAVAQKWLKILGIIGIPTAIGVHGGTGSIFGVVMAKPYWNTGLTPILFLVSALVSGSALMTYIYAFFAKDDGENRDMVKSLAQLMMLFIAVDFLLVAAEYLVGLYNAKVEEHGVFLSLLFGQHAPFLFLGQLLLGVVVPAALLFWKGNSRKALGLAGLSAVLGIISVRINLILPAFVVPHFPGLDKAYIDSRLTFQYFPNAMEWSISVGLIALFILVFSLVVKNFPIFELKEVSSQHGRAANTGMPYVKA